MRSPLDEWRQLTAVLRQGERDARAEGERAISAAIRDLHETWLPLLEALRQRVGLDCFDPLDAVAQVALDAEIQRLRRSLDATAPAERDQRGGEEMRERSRRWRERIWTTGSIAKTWAEPWSKALARGRLAAPRFTPRPGAPKKIRRKYCDLRRT